MGLTATFSVAATGSSLQYQWAKSGSAIAGATRSTYVTPATAFADTGTTFRVTVSNSAGSVTSQAATLTVTARAPMTGDLRFQQVDAPSTVNGWAGAGLSTFLLGRYDSYYAPSIGSPLWVGSAGNCSTPPVTDGTGCEWAYQEVPFAVTASSPELLSGYGSDVYSSFQADLQSTTWPGFGNGTVATSPSSVITSLDLEPANILFAVSWIQSAQQSGFELLQNTVAPADLQAAAAAEGAAGRVITAISINNLTVTYLSYGWQADTATTYEETVATASTANAPAAAAGLAAQGYIITATGQADYTGDIYLVGTRVQGDTLARPFSAVPGGIQTTQPMQQGYALVGVIVNLAEPIDPYTFLFER